MSAPSPVDTTEFTEKIQHFCNLYNIPFHAVIVVCSGAMHLAVASMGRTSRRPNDVDIAVPIAIYNELVKAVPNAITVKAPIGTYTYKSIKVREYQVDFAPRWGDFSYGELRNIAKITPEGLAHAPLTLFVQYKKAMTREKDKQDVAFAEQLLPLLEAE